MNGDKNPFLNVNVAIATAATSFEIKVFSSINFSSFNVILHPLLLLLLFICLFLLLSLQIYLNVLSPSTVADFPGGLVFNY